MVKKVSLRRSDSRKNGVRYHIGRLAVFACGKNGERSRKASLHAASAALHSKPKVFSLATA